jgi:hypothetical protein
MVCTILSMNLEPAFADINRCEIDFFIFASPRKHWKEKKQIAFGECKTTNLIERQDIENLVKVRDALKH